jgi:hypothetical protein
VLPAIVNNVDSPACAIPIEQHRVSLTRSALELSPRPLTLLSRNSEKTNLQGRVQWHTVSSVTRFVTWRVMEMLRAVGFFTK